MVGPGMRLGRDWIEGGCLGDREKWKRKKDGWEIWNWSRHVVYCSNMAKSNIISIDLNVWTTQTKKAKDLGLNESTIRQRVNRTKKGKGLIKEEFWDIPELSLTLVKK